MVPLDHVLALAVLIAPAGPPGEAFAAPEHACVWRTVQETALSLELLDPREARYVLARPGDFEADVPLLRRRNVDLRAAPPLTDAWRFPPADVAHRHLAFNRTFHRDLTLRRDAMGGHFGLDAALAENDRLYKVWDAVRDANSEFYYVSVRRQALAQLRRLIGPDAYHKAELPPPIPGWLRD
jgi:hypothetical protein